MAKIGRNDPCPCGSGKKYKKCCWEKDQEKLMHSDISSPASKEKWEPETVEDLPEEKYGEYLEPVEEFPDEESYEDEEFYEDTQNEKPEKITNKAYPTISPAEQKLVDTWWDKYLKLKKTDEIKKHIQHFMDSHPHLVENLEMEHEVLFELCADYRREGRLDEYIPFLLKIRNEFSSTYIRSAGYYDSDIIAWLIANKRSNEIEHYLNYFTAYPVEFVNQLFEMVNLLLATDNTEPLPAFIFSVYKTLIESPEVINGDTIVTPLITYLASKYFKPDYTIDDITQLVKDISNEISIPLNDNTISIDFWKSKFDLIFRPFEKWPDQTPKKKSQLQSLYFDMVNNFMRYLHEHKSISWISAQYYTQLIYSYLYKTLEETKGKPGEMFNFHKTTIDKIGASLTQSFIFLDATKALSLLNVIYHFAGYLQLCGNINEQQKVTIQSDCTALRNNLYPSLEKGYTEALCFPVFPFWV